MIFCVRALFNRSVLKNNCIYLTLDFPSTCIFYLYMQFKLERKYDDDILCSYENTLEDMFEKVGLIEVPEGTKAAASVQVKVYREQHRVLISQVHTNKTTATVII